MNAILLQSGGLRDYRPLGADGNPVYLAAPQLRAAMKRQLGNDIADYFAIPRRSDDGDRIDWYAPREGLVVPWSAATGEEQRAAKQELLTARERILETGTRMQVDEETERKAFGRLLQHVMSFPNQDHLYLVNGRPVVTFWGFLEHDAALDHDSLALLPVMEPDSVAAPATPASGSMAQAAGRGRRFGWLWRWWWLLLPLLLLLLFLLLRGCDGWSPGGGLPGLPDLPGLPGPGKLPTGGSVPDLPLDRGSGSGLQQPDLDASIDGDGSGPTLGESDMPEEPGATTANEEPPVPEETLPVEGESPPETDVPPEEETLPAEEEPMPEQEPVPANAEPPSEKEKSGAPLVIPPEAVRDGSTDFLNGRWRSDAGLMDRTGRPIDVEYEFRDGEGVARYNRSDGVVCQGPTSASMKGSRLVINDRGNITCPDGVRFRKSRVECNVGQEGLADCQGSYATGENFSVGMTQADPE